MDRQEWRWWRIESNTWNRPQKELYEYFQRKRLHIAKQEIENLKALNAEKTGSRGPRRQ